MNAIASDVTAVPLAHRSALMARVVDLARRVASSDANLLVAGESGTGKGLLARFIHETSPRHSGPFVTITCANIAADLLESELFGHEKGAFTGAVEQKKGRFELADGGTILIDGVSELQPPLQGKLLRVVQERSFERLAGTRTISVDVRILASTQADLEALVAAVSFRKDLFYRLNVIRIEIPPLRDRLEDVLQVNPRAVPDPLRPEAPDEGRARPADGTLVAGKREGVAERDRRRSDPGGRPGDPGRGDPRRGHPPIRSDHGGHAQALLTGPARGGVHPRGPATDRQQSQRGRPDPRHQPQDPPRETQALRDSLRLALGLRDRKEISAMAMAKKQLEAYKKRLLEKKKGLAEAYNKNKTYGRLTEDEGTQDLADKASSAYTKEFLYSLSNTDREILQQVDEALHRIAKGTYGVCMECGEEIEKKRHEAVPWASHCLSCQAKVEKGLL